MWELYTGNYFRLYLTNYQAATYGDVIHILCQSVWTKKQYRNNNKNNTFYGAFVVVVLLLLLSWNSASGKKMKSTLQCGKEQQQTLNIYVK